MSNASRVVVALLLSLFLGCAGSQNSVQNNAADTSREGDAAIAGEDAAVAAKVDLVDVGGTDGLDVASEALADLAWADAADVLEVSEVLVDAGIGDDSQMDDLGPMDVGLEIPDCVPNCDGTSCGDDGCGGSCDCAGNHECVDTLGDGSNLLCLYTCDFTCAELTACGEYFVYDGISCDCGGCDDGDVCTDDLCEMDEEGSGSCQFVPNAAGCDDGNPCTGPDLCGQGLCVGPLMSLEDLDGEECLCKEDIDCDPLDDGNACNGSLQCVKADVDESGVCQIAPESIPGEGAPCGAPDGGNVCQAGLCVCLADCDGKECGPDGCQGSCGDCDWTQDCADGACVIKNCDFLCNGIQCGAVGPNGECICGTCDDEDPCTVDSCDEEAAWCVFDTEAGLGLACDDQVACTQGDSCTPEGCKGEQKVCDDKVECTSDSCHPTKGCQHVAMTILCVDQTSCTMDSCDLELGCLNLPNDSKCDDGNPCTFGYCDPENSCTYGAVPEGFPCGQPLGWGKCSVNGACQCAPVCQENGCGNDGCGGNCGDCGEWGYDCVKGECIPDCELWCEIPECGPAGQDGECYCGDCDDCNPCTTDICEPDATCGHLYNYEEGCDDGSACTTDDHCLMGACAGSPVDCDDDNECTVDLCDPGTGQCLHDAFASDGIGCDDGVPCTSPDECQAGVCKTQVKLCDDGSACTVDSCDETTGACQHAPLPDGTDCDDDLECSLNDLCLAGRCMGERPSNQAVPPGCSCVTDEHCQDDDNVCNGKLYCDIEDGLGVCVVEPTSLNPCDDGVDCTDDLCTADFGCSNPVVHAVCADDVACTTDYCHPIGGCSNIGWGVNCDDGNECTSDMCNAPGGCSYTPLQNGTACGEVEGWGHCQAGECSCKWKCEGIECGNNGCGGSCGECPGEANECVLGKCQCAPDCSTKECGPDGCGGYCGGCDWENAECGEDFKCHCFHVECGKVCCAVQEECVDGICQNLINPPPVRLSFGEVTSTSMEIMMVNDEPVSALSLNFGGIGLTYAGGGLVGEHFPMNFTGTSLFIGLGMGAAIPPGEGVLINVEFEEKQTGSGLCLVGDYNGFGGPDGPLDFIVVPPCYWWP